MGHRHGFSFLSSLSFSSAMPSLLLSGTMVAGFSPRRMSFSRMLPPVLVVVLVDNWLCSGHKMQLGIVIGLMANMFGT